MVKLQNMHSNSSNCLVYFYISLLGLGLKVARSAIIIERLVIGLKSTNASLNDHPGLQFFGNNKGTFALVHWLDLHLDKLFEILKSTTITVEIPFLMEELHDCSVSFKYGRSKKIEDSRAGGRAGGIFLMNNRFYYR